MAKDIESRIAPFTIIIDTREQLPYRFDDVRIDRRKSFVWTQTKTLSTGDYSIAGFEDRICVERKSLVDLYGTLGASRERFEREFERMQDLDSSLVVIEASWREIASPDKKDDGEIDYNWSSSLSSNAVLGTIVTWAGKYPKTRWKAAGSRKDGEKVAFKFLLEWFQKQENKEER